MGLSKLAEKCKKCPKVDSCDHKRMEALAYMPKGGFAVGGIIPLIDTEIEMVGTLNGKPQVSCVNQIPNTLDKDLLEAIKKSLAESLTITIGRS